MNEDDIKKTNQNNVEICGMCPPASLDTNHRPCVGINAPRSQLLHFSCFYTLVAIGGDVDSYINNFHSEIWFCLIGKNTNFDKTGAVQSSLRTQVTQYSKALMRVTGGTTSQLLGRDPTISVTDVQSGAGAAAIQPQR